MSELDNADAAALTALLSALADPGSILKTWQSKDLFSGVGENGVRMSMGAAASPTIPVVVARYEQALGRPFPRLLSAFLEAHDGLQVYPTADGRIVIAEDPELDVTNGLLPARNLESDETSDLEHSGLRIGKAYHQARILLIDEGERNGEVVCDDGDGLVVLGSSLADFFRELLEYGLSIEAMFAAKA